MPLYLIISFCFMWKSTAFVCSSPSKWNIKQKNEVCHLSFLLPSFLGVGEGGGYYRFFLTRFARFDFLLSFPFRSLQDCVWIFSRYVFLYCVFANWQRITVRWFKFMAGVNIKHTWRIRIKCNGNVFFNGNNNERHSVLYGTPEARSFDEVWGMSFDIVHIIGGQR